MIYNTKKIFHFLAGANIQDKISVVRNSINWIVKKLVKDLKWKHIKFEKTKIIKYTYLILNCIWWMIVS